MQYENKALFVQRLNEALVECGAPRYDSLISDPLVYEASEDGSDEHVYVRSAPYRKANVHMDSLPAMLHDIYMAGLV